MSFQMPSPGILASMSDAARKECMLHARPVEEWVELLSKDEVTMDYIFAQATNPPLNGDNHRKAVLIVYNKRLAEGQTLKVPPKLSFDFFDDYDPDEYDVQVEKCGGKGQTQRVFHKRVPDVTEEMLFG